MNKLPKTLEKEPLIEAVFEVRFGGDPQLAELLPGVLFGQFKQQFTVQRLPPADIPKPIRAQDPNLMFMPTVRMDCDKVTISAGDRNIVVGCKLPYPKWPVFREEILRIVKVLASCGIESPVERYSLKYVNLIQGQSYAEQIGKIDMSVRLGDVDAVDNHLSVQLVQKDNNTLHMITVVTSAVATLNGSQAFGVIVDVDSIREHPFPTFVEFSNKLEPDIESLRL